MGQAVQNGITLFKEREGEKVSRLQCITEDTKYDGKEAVTVVRKLADADKAQLVMVWGNTPANAAAPVLESLHIRAAYISHEDHSSKNPQAIDLGPSASACLAPLAERVRQVGIKNFGTIGIDIGNVVSYLDNLDKEVGSKLFREIVSNDATQFQAQLLKGKARGITTYLLAMMPEQALLVARQAKQLNLSLSVIGIDAFADDTFLREISKIQPDLSFVYGEVQPWFKSAYRKRFGNGGFLLEAASGYVFAQVAAQAMSAQPKSKSFADTAHELPLGELAYKDARISAPGVRLSAPCRITTAEEYLHE
jgi:ABC-type branched-subunit amino acid transport system substrate-binding protein